MHQWNYYKKNKLRRLSMWLCFQTHLLKLRHFFGANRWMNMMYFVKHCSVINLYCWRFICHIVSLTHSSQPVFSKYKQECPISNRGAAGVPARRRRRGECPIFDPLDFSCFKSDFHHIWHGFSLCSCAPKTPNRGAAGVPARRRRRGSIPGKGLQERVSWECPRKGFKGKGFVGVSQERVYSKGFTFQWIAFPTLVSIVYSSE